jgi:nucleoside-diphosphate kinase
MPLERTFSLVKPDGVARGLVGEILRRFEARGLRIVALKMLTVPRPLAEAYYSEHKGKGFYEGLIRYITSGPAVAMVLEGDDAVAVCRLMMGATDPKKAGPGTIRGDFAQQIGRNVIHGSDSVDSAKREVSLFFTAAELQDHRHVDASWLFE